MRQWLASLSFWPLMTYVWSAWLMFVIAASMFGFHEVTGALGNLADRLGLEATEEMRQ